MTTQDSLVCFQKSLRSVRVADGELQRSLVTVGDAPVVLFHKHHRILPPKFATEGEWTAFLQSPRQGAVVHLSDKGCIWNRVPTPCFNCHTLAIGSFLELGPRDWLEGSASMFTLMENPAQVLLERFFYRVLRTDKLQELDIHARCENDVVLLRDDVTDDLTHSARVQWIEGVPLLLSKLGEHPIVLSTLDVLYELYRGQFTVLEVHRFRSECASMYQMTDRQHLPSIQHAVSDPLRGPQLDYR